MCAHALRVLRGVDGRPTVTRERAHQLWGNGKELGGDTMERMTSLRTRATPTGTPKA